MHPIPAEGVDCLFSSLEKLTTSSSGAAPSFFLRSSMFNSFSQPANDPVVYSARRPLIHTDTPDFYVAQIGGQALCQLDLDMLATLTAIAQAGGSLNFTLHIDDTLARLGPTRSTLAREGAHASLMRLKAAVWSVRKGPVANCKSAVACLINDVSANHANAAHPSAGLYHIRLNPILHDMLSLGPTFLSVAKRRALRKTPLAGWLYNYIRSGPVRDGAVLDLSAIKALCGRSHQTNELFNATLRKELDALRAAVANRCTIAYTPAVKGRASTLTLHTIANAGDTQPAAAVADDDKVSGSDTLLDGLIVKSSARLSRLKHERKASASSLARKAKPAPAPTTEAANG